MSTHTTEPTWKARRHRRLAVAATALVMAATASPAGARPCHGCDDPELPPPGGDPGCSLALAAGSDPTVSANPRVGTLAQGTRGNWTGASSGITYSYAWYRGTQQIASVTSATYTPVAADVGHPLRFRVKATHATLCPGGRTEYSDASAAVAPGAAPTVVTAPVVSGTPAVGQTMSVSSGSWSYSDGGSATSYNYRWYRNSQPMPDYTHNSPTYTVKASDHGSTISVHVQAVRAGWSLGNRASNHVAVPTPTVKSVTVPVISGEALPGKTLSATGGTWNPAPTSLTHAWLRNGTPIAGATLTTYRVTEADRGHALTVRVTASTTHYNPATAVSAPVQVPVAPVPDPEPEPEPEPEPKPEPVPGPDPTPVTPEPVTPEPVGPPTTDTPALTWTGPRLRLKGKARVGRTLRLSRTRKQLLAGFGASSVKYQWFRGNKRIKGATKATYKLRKADRKKPIRVRITARRSGHQPGTLWSSRLRVRT